MTDTEIPPHTGLPTVRTSENESTTRPRARDAAAALPADRLQSELVGLAQRLSSGTYELLVLVGELDARGTWAIWGALSCAAWLADACDIELCTARTQVRVARALREHSQLDTAMRNGEVSYAKARVLIPYLNDGNVGAVCAVIDAHVARSDAPAGASLAQQRADALATVVTGGGGDVPAEVVVHVRADANALADGTPLSDHAVAALLPKAFVSLLVHDSQRQPIDASPRRRFPTRRQRRVIDEFHGECQHPGCHARTFLQYDHIQPYHRQGPTVIANLQRLCGPHNRARHDQPTR